MGITHVLITGPNPDGAAVTKSIIMQLLRGMPVSLNPLIIAAVMNATADIGALANTSREIWVAISEPAVQVVNKNKPAKPKTVTSHVMRKQMWNDLVEVSVP